MVTLAYKQSYIWLAHRQMRPLAKSSAQKYDYCVVRADNT